MTGGPRILYLDTIKGERNEETTLAGIRRYAASRGWEAETLRYGDSRPKPLRTLLKAFAPIAGCVVECADGRVDLPPDFFGDIPVVYLHAPPTLYGGGIARMCTDNEAVARAAFRELSEGRPESFAFVGFRGRREWSDIRERTFAALAAKAGKDCFIFPWRKETARGRIERLVPWLTTLPRRCAIFAVNDLTAAEVAEAAQEAHRSIPRELTLLGVDNNTTICESTQPALSSIQIDFERAGFVAARMVGEKIGTTGTHETAATRKAGSPRCPIRPISPSSPAPTVIGPLLAVRRRSTGGAGRREKFVLEAVEMIRREACEGLTASDLANRFPCSERLFTMRFREATGHSILDEIQQVRLEKVFTLLKDTNTPIGVIADFCGYRSAIALRWIFRKRTGMSMQEWRNKNRH